MQIFNVMQKTLGDKVTSFLVKPIFYNQFVGGETVPEMNRNIEKLTASGSDNIILIVAEEAEK